MHQEKYRKKENALMWKEDISIKLTKKLYIPEKRGKIKNLKRLYNE